MSQGHLDVCLLQVTVTVKLRRTVVEEEAASKTIRKATPTAREANRSVDRRARTGILAEVSCSLQSHGIAVSVRSVHLDEVSVDVEDGPKWTPMEVSTWGVNGHFGVGSR